MRHNTSCGQAFGQEKVPTGQCGPRHLVLRGVENPVPFQNGLAGSLCILAGVACAHGGVGFIERDARDCPIL